MAVVPATRTGPYEVLGLLGTGGMELVDGPSLADLELEWEGLEI